jgi:hypothetical protein
MKYDGETSQFAATHDVLVYAHDPANGNTGVDRTTFFTGK